MQAYIWGVCGAVIITALAVLLLPEGKTGKFIHGILKLFCLLVMLTPLFGLFEQFFAGEPAGGNDMSAEAELDDGFIEYMFSRRAQEEEQRLEEWAEEEFGVAASAQVLWEYAEYAYNVTEVKINIKNFGMNGDDEHIFIIGQIETRLKEWLPDAEVTVYG